MTWKLPVIFIIENNFYAMGTSVERTSNVTDLSTLGASFEMPSESVDGMRPETVCDAISRAVERGRSNIGANSGGGGAAVGGRDRGRFGGGCGAVCGAGGGVVAAVAGGAAHADDLAVHVLHERVHETDGAGAVHGHRVQRRVHGRGGRAGAARVGEAVVAAERQEEGEDGREGGHGTANGVSKSQEGKFQHDAATTANKVVGGKAEVRN